MHTNKLILNYCPNFDKVINTDFLEDDAISLKLVNIYKDFIFKISLDNESDILKVKELDRVMGKYVEDYFFRKRLQQELLTIRIKESVTDALRVIVDSIIGIFKKYELESTRKIYISRWI